MARSPSKRHSRRPPVGGGPPLVPRRVFGAAAAGAPPWWWVALMLVVGVAAFLGASAINVSYVTLLLQRASVGATAAEEGVGDAAPAGRGGVLGMNIVTSITGLLSPGRKTEAAAVTATDAGEPLGAVVGAADDNDDGMAGDTDVGGAAAEEGTTADTEEVGMAAPTPLPPRMAPTGRHLYMSKSGESVTVMDNLCIAANGSSYTLRQPLACGWTFGHSGALRMPSVLDCTKKEDASFQYMKIPPPVVVSRFDASAAPALRHRVNLGGETLFLTLAAAATNLAHYTGSMTHMYHVLRNAGHYGLTTTPTRIVIAVEGTTSPSFKNPHGFHSILLRAAAGGGPIHHVDVAPAFPLPEEPPAGDPALGGTPGGGPLVTVVLNNKVVSALVRPVDTALCMRRVVIPNFPRGRWFIPASDLPVPSGLLPPHGSPTEVVQQAIADASLWRQQQMEAEGDAPADATPWRSAVFAALVPPLMGGRPTMTRRLTYLIRVRRRAFDEPSEARMQALLRRVAARHRLVLDMVNFGNMSFSEQLRSVVHSAVLVGIHGANLVNTLYAPRGAHLIEIFPRKFTHTMYVRGGDAGLGYTAVTLEEPGQADFEGLSAFDSVTSCMNKDPNCKLWYRADTRALELSKRDEAVLEKALDVAVAEARPPP
ncbi:hypothetical protein MMPV_009811 [Pyropia vietnamensis]